MIAGRLHRAARARLERIRHGETGQDGGFALVFVLLVTMVITSAVAITLAVTTPNIARTKDDRDRMAALSAAQAGVEDFVARLATIPACRSTSKVCADALGASSGSVPTKIGTDQTFTWHSDSGLTGDYNVRVRSTGRSGNATKSLVGDVALARGILSFGYYTDYESQSPSFLYNYFAGRDVYLSSHTAYDQIDLVNVDSATKVHWYGPPTTGANPMPASICGQHWYREAGSTGRFSYGSNSVWGEKADINSRTVTRNASCDVVFTTGMTIDGPVYTRDAMLISDQTVGGKGPIFKQPVYSLWGYNSGAVSYAYPAPPATMPWRQDDNAGGTISSESPYRPATATFDLQLPKDIGSEGLPDDRCVFYGPTRVKLNGDGTAQVTSPQTTTRAAGSDANCYPTGSLAGGIVDFHLNVHSGDGAIYVKNAIASGDTAPAQWPSTGTKSTDDDDQVAQQSAIYLSSPAGGSATPDENDTSAATDSCSTTVKYKNVASYPCAWTNVASSTDVGTGDGWTGYSSTAKCNSGIAATNRQLFECEYTNTTGGTVPSASNRYGALRTLIQGDLANGTCLTGTAAAQTTCLTNLVNSRVQTANTAGHPANYASPANGDHRYLVTATSAGTPSQGTAKTVGSTPTPPLQNDPLFSSTSTAAREAATKTPITLTVSRQTYGCINGSGTIIGSIVKLLSGLLGCLVGVAGWGNTTPQFTTTVTQSKWSIINQASGASYFPSTADVTKYNGRREGAHGTSWPGDLYVEGNNQGRLSLLADNDVVVTGDIDSPVSPNNAVDVVAGNNVRNYHPVTCNDQTDADIDKTDAGWCPNDITGLYRGASGLVDNGVLTAAHPAKQYTNLTMPGQPTTCRSTIPDDPTREIDAAVFTLSGSFLTDNYNRGCQLGKLQVNGGIYQSHRGANGVQWEYQTGDSKRATSGYSLQYHYVDLQHADLPYTPPVNGDSNGRIWTVVSVSSGSGS